ncbi:MAG: hypothetical protein ABL880_00980 [Methylotenera sp.]
MELLLRRRAIFTGMRPYFDDHELLEAIHLWQAEYAQKPKFALSAFVARCCSSPQLKAQRASILGAIFSAFDFPENKLLPDPLEVLKLSKDSVDAHHHVVDAKTKVFTELLVHILLKFNGLDQQLILNYLIAHLPKIKTDERRTMHLRVWLSRQIDNLHANSLQANFSAEILQQLINISYVAMCEYAGPVRADQFLSQAMKETEPLAASLDFKLHDLL